MTGKPTSRRLLSTRDVARMLDVSVASVANWIDEGLLVAGRTPGGHRRVTAAELLKFIRRQKLPVPAELEPPPPTRILIVDDEPQVRRWLAQVIAAKQPNWEVLQAPDGYAAGELVAQRSPDLILVDLNMPGLDGFDVCRRIKSNPATADTRVIAMTGEFTAEREERIKGCGALACLAKPLSADVLLGLLRSVLPEE